MTAQDGLVIYVEKQLKQLLNTISEQFPLSTKVNIAMFFQHCKVFTRLVGYCLVSDEIAAVFPH